MALAALPAEGRLAGSTGKAAWREQNAGALWALVFARVDSEARDRPHTLRAAFTGTVTGRVAQVLHQER